MSRIHKSAIFIPRIDGPGSINFADWDDFGRFKFTFPTFPTGREQDSVQQQPVAPVPAQTSAQQRHIAPVPEQPASVNNGGGVTGEFPADGDDVLGTVHVPQ
ncbi:MAG: hypothetical protein ACFNLR_04775, partial [Prevotella denticola]